jgi:hypothetical protein
MLLYTSWTRMYSLRSAALPSFFTTTGLPLAYVLCTPSLARTN